MGESKLGADVFEDDSIVGSPCPHAWPVRVLFQVVFKASVNSELVDVRWKHEYDVVIASALFGEEMKNTDVPWKKTGLYKIHWI